MLNNTVHSNLLVEDRPTYSNLLVKDAATEADLDTHGHLTYGSLVLEDGTRFEGTSFGYEDACAGEVVFCTGMVGYPEALTDASFAGQILAMTYPIMGNYGVPDASMWEDDRIHVSGLIVSHYVNTPSHAQSIMTLEDWLKREKIPALEIKDTRLLTQHLRKNGSMLGKILFDRDIDFSDPNKEQLMHEVSVKEVQTVGTGDTTIALLDCGAKRNIVRSLLARNVRVVTVPWDYDLFSPDCTFDFDGILISNGPGNPKLAGKTIQTIRTALERNIPTMGICMGHQLLALAAGGDTYKLKFGHRSQNQPCLMQGTKRCYITTQNQVSLSESYRQISSLGLSMPMIIVTRGCVIPSCPSSLYNSIQKLHRVLWIPSGSSTTFSRR